MNTVKGKGGMYANRKSDGLIVPAKAVNNGGTEPSAESPEESSPAKRNVEQNALFRTQSRIEHRSSGLSGVREAARKDSKLRFTALMHHIDEDCLRKAFSNLKKAAAVGIDEVTWHEYEQNVEANIADLHDRIHRGAYRAKPTRRVWIPKTDGRQRPIGITSLEDKIVQQAVVWVLQSIYEQDFIGFSYGFRPGRGQHHALDALTVAITENKVNWILDADIAGFFDNIDHEWLMRFLEHRIGDRRILRLIRKWLRAGVSEEGEWSETKVGTPQGAVISPLLANVYLHYVLDLWIKWQRKRRWYGEVVVVRYADDFVVGFQHEGTAKRFMDLLRGRFAKFGLELHESKTRLIEFGRYAEENRAKRGDRRPETFEFLGFTHMCARTHGDRSFTVHRHTTPKRMRATLAAIKAQLRERWHHRIDETGRWLRKVVQGWLNYHAVPSNYHQISRFVNEVRRMWLRALRRRSQRGRRKWTWRRMQKLSDLYLPRPRILHPYPRQRFCARLKAGAV